MTTTESVAATITEQLGGTARAYEISDCYFSTPVFTFEGEGVRAFANKGATWGDELHIILTADDLYTVRTYRNGQPYKTIQGVFCDMLAEIVEEITT